jgi:hypothetical protein
MRTCGMRGSLMMFSDSFTDDYDWVILNNMLQFFGLPPERPGERVCDRVYRFWLELMALDRETLLDLTELAGAEARWPDDS